ncbi:tigger transposable element-derived protein 6-like [Octopus sinensis]|uniref:Tigger transposable element-derived protein 6-like n=1 Tax=Octopus sinensis TaxID=2607531 RepID=A0A6P7U6U2_9MOLL|nr:tigger transposable element-derived protein 6-like [Octopus sinensis]
MNNLGIQYANSNKSWMTSLIFKNWVERLNSKMSVENRKILLLLYNAPVHYFDGEFSNIELYFLPPKTTSKIQPIDQGIVHSFKSLYKKGMTRNLSMGTNIGTLSYTDELTKFKLVNALPLIIEAWNEVTVDTIKNCFNKALNNWAKIDEKILEESTDEKVLNLNHLTIRDNKSDNPIGYADALKYLENIEKYFLQESGEHIHLITN